MDGFQMAYEQMKVEGRKCRDEASKYATQADIWERSAELLVRAIRKNEQQNPSESNGGKNEL